MEKTELEQLKIECFDIMRQINMLNNALQTKSQKIAELEQAQPKKE